MFRCNRASISYKWLPTRALACYDSVGPDWPFVDLLEDLRDIAPIFRFVLGFALLDERIQSTLRLLASANLLAGSCSSLLVRAAGRAEPRTAVVPRAVAGRRFARARLAPAAFLALLWVALVVTLTRFASAHARLEITGAETLR